MHGGSGAANSKQSDRPGDARPAASTSAEQRCLARLELFRGQDALIPKHREPGEHIGVAIRCASRSMTPSREKMRCRRLASLSTWFFRRDPGIGGRVVSSRLDCSSWV